MLSHAQSDLGTVMASDLLALLPPHSLEPTLSSIINFKEIIYFQQFYLLIMLPPESGFSATCKTLCGFPINSAYPGEEDLNCFLVRRLTSAQNPVCDLSGLTTGNYRTHGEKNLPSHTRLGAQTRY